MDVRLSVAYFSNSNARAGVEEHMLTLLRGLDRRRFRLCLICPPGVAAQLRPDLPDDVELVALSVRRPTDAVAALRLRRVLRERRVHILHSHQFYSSLFASPLGWASGVPIVIETPHLRESWRHGWFKSRFFVDRLVGRFVDHYIAVSEANARYLARHKGLPRRKIVVIRNGCDLSRFESNGKGSSELRQIHGLAGPGPLILVLGRLEPQKGHRVLLEAWPRVLREFSAARLVLAGDGALRRELEERARALGIEASVRLVGFQKNPEAWLSLADMTVLPSFFEGLPLAAIESLAAGRPMVATAVDGTPEVVVDGRTGITVPPGDPEKLAAGICRLLGRRDERERMGREGRLWVREHFSQEQQIRRTEGLYLSAWAKLAWRPSRRSPLAPELGAGSSVRRGGAAHDRVSPSPDREGEARREGPSSRSHGRDEPQGAIRSAVCEATVRSCVGEWGDRLRAIVLTGSLARGEATFVRHDAGWRALGDAEFFLVLRDGARSPAGPRTDELRTRIESALARRGIACPIGLAVIRPHYLRSLRPAISAYELRTCGQVVWGDPGVLSLIPGFTKAEIPLEDAWRLLCNRMIELLEVFERSQPLPREAGQASLYRVVKLYLDMGTSLSVFLGAYEPTYRQRAERLSRRAESGAPGRALPFPLEGFIGRVRACTEFKVSAPQRQPAFALGRQDCDVLQECLSDARELWRWELRRMTGAPEGLSDAALMGMWMRMQPLSRRLRGWLHALRRTGAHGVWLWPAWARRAWRASPRSWVYLAASLTLFRIRGWPHGEMRDGREAPWEELERLLPVRRTSADRRATGWQHLVTDILWNYRAFLEGTLA